MAEVALATCRALPDLDPDDAPLVAALRARGLDASPRIWDLGPAAFASADLVVVRSTWDYALRRDAFVSWAAAVESTTKLCNPASVLRWNTHKRYLRDLEEAGVPIVPTRFVEEGGRASLASLLQDLGAHEGVVKPAVSAGARRTSRVRADAAGQQALDELLRDADALVQPLLPAIETEGELSLVYFDGRFSHAVRKTPAAGDFRVQEEHGGRFSAAAADDEARQAGEACLRATGGDLAYARVDLVRGLDGRLRVIELELVEPSLYFAHAAGAADRFADAIVRRLGRRAAAR